MTVATISRPRWRSCGSSSRVPVFTGLPFGHVPDKLTLPVGGECALTVRGGRANLTFGGYAS